MWMANHDVDNQLRAQALSLLQAIDTQRLASRAAELDLLIHDAEAREHRRAAFDARDAACYRLGSAFEPFDALDLDPVALVGWLETQAVGVALLAQHVLAAPGASITECLRTLFASPVGRQLRAIGVWKRWRWLHALYDAEVSAFLASNAGRRPERWKPKPPTPRQRYLCATIAELLQKEPPTFSTRAAAFEWLREQGGNPRFTTEPVRPDIADITAALR
ncbi:hypothetical protein [Sphingomonas sp. ID0503]|uniref:hypothetical protein n=1 Tax=Sphingomonas sp. ID0503 TaxID=3399691 RepID=UPI003AFB8056